MLTLVDDTRAQFRVSEVTREPAWRGVVVRGAAEQNPRAAWTPVAGAAKRDVHDTHRGGQDRVVMRVQSGGFTLAKVRRVPLPSPRPDIRVRHR